MAGSLLEDWTLDPFLYESIVQVSIACVLEYEMKWRPKVS